MKFDATTDRLNSLDEWGDRKFIVPGKVRGHWRTWRTRVQFVLLLIFLITPWTEINGIQTLWLDIPARRFAVFGRVFLSHEAPLIFFILALAVLGLSLVTALWGRVWCGWACPQTVFIDGLYRRIEEWIEGSPLERRKLKAAPLGPSKILKVSAKWAAFLTVSSVVAHSFIAYFAGASELLSMMQGEPAENLGYFLSVTSVTALIAFDFGWFREQFCIIMCPYGRFQSVLMDDDSITVSYDQARGEPRRNLAAAGARGDCVSCNRCVDVCPTAIDIRNGTQMECIGCTACIDACNEIMAKVNKPPNLIRYQSQQARGLQWKRPRVLINIFLVGISAIGLVTVLFQREDLYASVLRAKDSPYQALPTGEILNHFKLHLHNQSQGKQLLEIQLAPPWQAQDIHLTIAAPQFELLQGQDKETHFFIKFPKELVAAQGYFDMEINVLGGKTEGVISLPIQLLGPKD